MARYKITVPAVFTVELPDDAPNPLDCDDTKAFSFVENVLGAVRNSTLSDTVFWYSDLDAGTCHDVELCGWSQIDWQIDDRDPYDHIRVVKS